MKKILFLLIFLIVPANAEIVTSTGKHKHLGEISANESCKIAIARAKKNAITKTLGQTISTDVVSSCSEIDGEYNCERNQLSLFELKGDITSWNEINRNDGKEIGSDIRFCEVTIKAKVVPVKQNLDPSFHFNVRLVRYEKNAVEKPEEVFKPNQKIYQSGDILEIKIDTSKKMYMSIFQWLPYGGKKYDKVTKIFPNKQFNKNVNNLINDNINLKYEVYFPEEIKQKKVDEYLVFIASERQIPWINEFTEIEGLKSQLHKTKILMEKHISGYIIIK